MPHVAISERYRSHAANPTGSNVGKTIGADEADATPTRGPSDCHVLGVAEADDVEADGVELSGAMSLQADVCANHASADPRKIHRYRLTFFFPTICVASYIDLVYPISCSTFITRASHIATETAKVSTMTRPHRFCIFLPRPTTPIMARARSMGRGRRTFLMAGSALIVAGACLTPQSALGQLKQLEQSFQVDRAVQRPPEQKGLDSSVSYIQRTVTWPSACDPAQSVLAFDYVVDSEANHDWVRLRVDGTVKWSASGNEAGHAIVKNLGCGPHLIHFEYSKDSSLSVGADDARIDNVSAAGYANGKGIHIFLDSFDLRYEGTPTGWSAGGTNGGWFVDSRRRPEAMRSPVAQVGAPNTTSWVSRSITWPDVSDGSELTFSYFVDSEPNDRLRVYDNGVLKWNMAGSNKSGRATISIGAGGTHEIKFAYTKDGSTDAGRDFALVDEVTVACNSMTLLRFPFDGEVIGEGPNGWSVGTSGLGQEPWVVTPPTPHMTHVRCWDSVVAHPVADGTPEEFGTAATRFAVPLHATDHQSTAPVFVAAAPSSDQVLLFLRMPAETPGNGDESGGVALTIDGNRAATVDHSGCGEMGGWPDSEDRQIQMEFSLAPGATSGSITSTQWQGNCSPIPRRQWTSLRPSQYWPVAGTILEEKDDDGNSWLNIELHVTLRQASLPEDPFPGPSEGFASHKIGLGLSAFRGTTSPVWVYLPYADGNAPSESDMTSLETVLLMEEGDTVPATENIDFCCFPAL